MESEQNDHNEVHQAADTMPHSELLSDRGSVEGQSCERRIPCSTSSESQRSATTISKVGKKLCFYTHVLGSVALALLLLLAHAVSDNPVHWSVAISVAHATNALVGHRTNVEVLSCLQNRNKAEHVELHNVQQQRLLDALNSIGMGEPPEADKST